MEEWMGRRLRGQGVWLRLLRAGNCRKYNSRGTERQYYLVVVFEKGWTGKNKSEAAVQSDTRYGSAFGSELRATETQNQNPHPCKNRKDAAPKFV